VVCTVPRAFAGTLSTALVNAKSASDRSLTFCSESATRKSKMAYIVLAVISSDISDDSDTNFIYILSANKCQRQIRQNDRKNFKANKTRNEITICLQKNTRVTCLNLTGSKFSTDSKKMRVLSREQIVQLRIVPENQDRSKNAP